MHPYTYVCAYICALYLASSIFKLIYLSLQIAKPKLHMTKKRKKEKKKKRYFVYVLKVIEAFWENSAVKTLKQQRFENEQTRIQRFC